MNILLRDATPDDAPAISEIIKDSMGYTDPQELIRENILRLGATNRDKIIVAEYDRQLVGFIHAEDYDCLYAPHLKDLMSLAVKKDFQNKGIGTMLLVEVEKWSKATGRQGVRILSSDNRTGAHKFYLSRGYVNEKIQLNFHKFF